MNSINNILKRLHESRVDEAKEFKYVFQIPWRQVTAFEDDEEYVYDVKQMEYAEEIMSAATDSFNEVDWLDYVPYDRRTEHSGIKSMEMKFNDSGDCFITVTTKIELDEDKINSLINYLSGQMSDGWGEGFEQRSIAHFKYEDEEWIEPYDDEDEGYYDTVEMTAQIYGQFYWYDKSHPWDIIEVSDTLESVEESIDEVDSSRDDVSQEIFKAIKDEVRKVMKSESFGFPDDEVDDYSTVDIYYQKLHDKDYIVVEVRAEVSYEGLEKLSDALNPIVSYYDKDAYFEPVTSGIIQAYISEEEAMKEDI